MKKRLSIILVIILILSSVASKPAKTSASELSSSVVFETIDKNSEIFNKISDKQEFKQTSDFINEFDEDEEVTVFVELESASVIDNYIMATEISNSGLFKLFKSKSIIKYNDYHDYANTLAADNQREQIEDEQDKVLDEIEEITKEDNFELVSKYSEISNLVTITVKAKYLKKIEELDNVKSLGVSHIYEVPKFEINYDSMGVNENGPIGSKLVHADDSNYKGDGMVIAVLDSGLDTNHEAFNVMPDNPKYNKDKINSFLEEKNFNAEKYNENCLKANTEHNGFISDKIPYAYDYADNDYDVIPSEESVKQFSNQHGTHVAGIIAGNAPDSSQMQFKGIVPNAQLVIMKVFSDNINGAYEYVILDALEDCLNLEVDVINMSLGSNAGFTSNPSDYSYKVFGKLSDAGIILAIACGNSHNSAKGNNLNGYSKASNPDTSMVAYPSTAEDAVSVASFENPSMILTEFTLSDGITKIYGNDPESDFTKRISSLMKDKESIDYVISEGYGEESSYEGIDVKGKIVVVSRGETSFDEKAEIAKKNDAIGMIVYDNINETTLSTMQLSNDHIPSCFISLSDYDFLKNAKIKTLTIKEGFANNNSIGRMSYFSNLGCTPDLKLKPEITGVGGNVYSAIPRNNNYQSLSGTSMAAPQISGVFAQILQYINTADTTFYDQSLKGAEKTQLATNLLLSTASIIETQGYSISNRTNDIKVPYSPRKQGAGLANSKAATTTLAYAYSNTNATKRPILNLEDNKEKTGIFTSNFNIKNLDKDSDATYSVKTYVMTETIDSGKILEIPMLLNAEVSLGSTDNNAILSGDRTTSLNYQNSISISNGNPTLSVNKNSDANLVLQISLSDSDKSYLENFINGEFVEGYIVLESKDNNEKFADLVIPFMGFYGDWTKAPVFEDYDIYEYCENYEYYEDSKGNVIRSNNTIPSIDNGYNNFGLSGLFTLGRKNGKYVYLGQNYLYNYYNASHDCIALSPDGDGLYEEMSYVYYTLRNQRELKFEIYSADDSTLYWKKDSLVYRTKSYQNNNSILGYSMKLNWDATDINGNKLPNNSKVKLKVSACVDYRYNDPNSNWDVKEYTITIDTEKPRLEKVIVNDDTMCLNISDNHKIMYCYLYDNNNESIGTAVNYYSSDLNDNMIVFPHNILPDSFYVDIVDFAGHTSIYNLNRDELIRNQETIIDPIPTITPTITPTNPGSYDPYIPSPGYIGGGDAGGTLPGETDNLPGENETSPTPSPIETPDDKPTITPEPIPDFPISPEVENALQNVIDNTSDIVFNVSDISKDNAKLIFSDELESVKKGNTLVKSYNEGEEFKYAWVFDTNSIDKNAKLKDIKAKVNISKQEVLPNLDGTLISLDQKGKLPVETKLLVNVSDKYKPGKKLYLYIKDNTNKLKSVPNNKIKVDKNGLVSLDIIQGGNYVLLEKLPPKNKRVSVINQVKVDKSLALGKGTTANGIVKLPNTIKKVNSLKAIDSNVKKAYYAAKITYKSSNPNIVKVSSNGKVTGKKKGNAKITVTITLSNGTKKKYTTAIRVK